MDDEILKASWIDSPLGSLVAVAGTQALYLLEFAQNENLDKEIARVNKKTKLPIIPGKTHLNHQIEEELKGYFSGTNRGFKTPLSPIGSPFQKRVWDELQKIPCNETRSYADIAAAIGNPSAFRAVGLANGANPIIIAIPCHRVINRNGKLGGYSSGMSRKEWLLKHERMT
jgi:AraC family transcriptional regulator, regulatory protein of adaptative response / methylated-DNA-[protein]-cysteine methyltransferase